MAYNSKTLQRQFWGAIGVGVLVCAIAVGWGSYSARQEGNKRSEQAASEQKNSAKPSYLITNVGGTIVIPPSQTKNAPQKAQDARAEPPPTPTFFELRLTDLALVLFTYCLVVVGWATMKSGELSAQDAERAYIFVGGTGELKPYAVGNIVHNMMTCQNSGKSFGVITEYYFGWSATKPSGRPTYPRTGVFFYGTEDLVCNPDQTVRLNQATGDISQTPYCFGFIKYRDIYKNRRTSRFAALLQNEKIIPFGDEPWNEWD